MHIIGILLFLMAAAFGASPAAAQQPGIVVKMGESVVFRLDHGQPVDPHPATGSGKPSLGEIRVDLRYANGMSTMVVTNNSGSFLNYHASITVDAHLAGKPTSVCTLMDDGRFSLETWPGQPLPGIRLSDFTPANQGQVNCQ